jgi:hypothetical protein
MRYSLGRGWIKALIIAIVAAVLFVVVVAILGSMGIGIPIIKTW